MFLIVFVTLMISIIGLYAQIFSVQANKLYNSQVGLMQTMVTWHGAATNLARANAASIPAAGCSLTAGAGLVSACTFGTLSGANLSLLPPNYNIGSFSFYSIAFQSGSIPYVITFVHDTNSAGNTDPTKNLLLPTRLGTEVGYSLNNLMRQFDRAAPTYLTYGTVTASGTLTVLTKTTGIANFPYSIPAAPVIPVGSLAVISTAQ